MNQSSAYLLVSHGSRDPRPQAAIDVLVQLVTAQRNSGQGDKLQENRFQGDRSALDHSTLDRSTLIRLTQTRSPNPLFKGAFGIPPFSRGARGDQGFKLQVRKSDLTEVLTQPTDLTPLIATAVLELHPLPLHEQICHFAEQAIALGYHAIEILPLFLVAGVHVTEDIPAEVAIAQTKLGDRIALEQSPHIGSYSSIQNLIVSAFEVSTGATQIVLAHGSRRSQGNTVIEAIAQRIGARTAYWSVPPSLESQVMDLIKAGCCEIAVLPYFLFAGGITDAIAQVVDRLAIQFPNVHFQLAQPLGANPAFANQLVDLMKR